MSTTTQPTYRLLAVHAHPDDECLTGAGTLIEAAENGHETMLVTCTGGELGEPGDPPAGSPEQLREVRAAELAVACSRLGISRLRFLGYRDSGMADTPENSQPGAFWSSDDAEATGRLVRLIREFRPHVVLTYDENGFYGHPDHVRAHQVTHLAFDAAGNDGFDRSLGEPWAPAKLYYSTLSHAALRHGHQVLTSHGLVSPFDGQDLDRLAWGVADDRVTLRLDQRRHAGRVQSALAAHRSQVGPDHFFLAMPVDVFAEVICREEFVLARSNLPVGYPESSLFDGLEAFAEVKR